MKLDVKIQLLTFFSHVFNSVFLVLGLSVAGCAVWILFDKGSLLTAVTSVELRTVGVGLLLIGGVVVLVSLIGCAGAHGENRLLLLVYLGLLIVLFLGQLFVTLLLLINAGKIEKLLDQTVDDIIVEFGQSGVRQDQLMDDVQKHGRCCGRMGPADWLMNSYIQTLNLTDPDVLPCSCFNSSQPLDNSTWCHTELLIGRGDSPYQKGCKQVLSVWLQENGLTVLAMDVGLIFIQVLQFVVMIYLYRAFGRKAALKRSCSLAESDHAHLDHAHLDHAHLDHAPDDDYAQQNYGYMDHDDGFIDPAHPEYYHDYQHPEDPAYMAYHHDNQNSY